MIFGSRNIEFIPSSNLIETRYGMPEQDAANTASYLLAGSIILYPIVSGMYKNSYSDTQ